MIPSFNTIPIIFRVATLCILLALGHGPWLQVHAAAPDGKAVRTVRVVMDNNYPPYVFVNNEGLVQGILPDQWRLWQEKTGIQVEITATDWKDALRDMKAGKYDILDTAFETEERKTWLDFGKPHTRIEVAAYFDKAISAITTADSLRGFVVAVKEGDAAIDLLKSQGVDNLVLFKGYEAIVQAAKEHKVNVFVVDTPPALYFLYKYGLQHDFKASPPINVGEFHRAVNKGRTALLREIEAGFALLSPGELASIEKKWYGASLLSGVRGTHLLVGGGSLGLVLLLLFLWNRSLRSAVRKRTAELERSREALRESEARYRELVEQARSIILRMDREGRICFLNDYALRFFGYQLADVIGQSVIGTIVPETDSAGKNLREMITDIGRHPDRYSTNENENICSDGRRVWISWTNNPLFDAEGQFSEILCMGNEITDRRMAEEALRRERQRLQFVIDGSRLGVWEWNVQTNETVFNETWAELLGYTIAELQPYSYATWEGLLHPDDVERARDALFACVEGKTSDYDCEIRMRHKSGHWVWILDRGKVFTRDAADRPLSMFGTHTDITSIKRAEEEREKLGMQLIQAQKMESVGRLAGGVAHDFNNMLSVIIGHCELALQGLESDHPFHAGLQNIRKAAERSADLTRQLLAFARKQTVAPKVLDINATVAGMLEMLRRLIGEDIDLVWQPGSNPGQVHIDPSQLDQILVNLFVNARDAIGDTGKVTIETDLVTIDERYCADHVEASPGTYVLLAVSDDGCGVDAATLPHLFEPFFTTKEMGKGTGLGLAMVYGIVKQNKGFINVYSEPGQGTTFKIYLPRHGADSEPAGEEVVSQAATGSETILVVEDEPMILEIATTMLENLGYTVLPASTPAEAIRLAREHDGTIQLLMTDVVMPEMNGRLLANHLRDLLPGLPCLFMSGYTANVIAHHGVLDEGVHFIQKPFSLHALAAKIREALATEGQ